ncbi:acyl-CoA thioester hydrolase [Saonia flava]|uniref:Acyl-CoA thioester hydrolase n=1 Tax=Saonia flava TaxID=523696 RepID=A0A846QY93_9FLAO|nr:acyl-CoA thioesterase [Saonia flava]NJB69589.1 acyl-CoA thioester hydrolase [Saonia flava]
MNVHEKVIRVKESDLDDLNHVNNVQYVHWIQDISREHWQLLASKDIQDSVIWVVINHNITYKNAAKLNDQIIVRTYVVKTEGCFSIRAVEMYNKETGDLYVHSETKFCLLNAKTRKPMKVPKNIEDIFSN